MHSSGDVNYTCFQSLIFAMEVRAVWFSILFCLTLFWKRIGGVMVSVLNSRTADRGFELQSGQIKDYEISFFFCLSPKLAPLKGKRKYGLSYINYTYSSTRYRHFERTNIQARFCPIGLEAIARITDRAFCDRILLSSILYSRYLFWIKQMHKKPFSFLCFVYALFVL